MTMRLACAATAGALGCALAATAAAETVYVTNEKSNTVSVIDGATLQVVKTIEVGQRPRGLVLSKDNKTLYVCASDSNEIEAIDLASGEVRPLHSTPDPERIDISPDGRLLFVSNEDSNLVTIIDAASGAAVDEIPVGVEPEGMGVSPDGRYVVNTSETTSMAHVIDIASHDIIANVLVDMRPRVAAWAPDGAQVWVSSEVGGTVSVIDAATFTVVKRIGFEIAGVEKQAIQPVGIAITRDRRTAFVALGPANRVAVIDAQSYAVKDYILVGQRVWGVTLNPDETRLYATNGLSNDVTVIDVKDLEALQSIPVGEEPWGSAVAP